MPRPKRCRWIRDEPRIAYWKPRGIPMEELREIALPMDGFEALRIADLEGRDQEAGAEAMGVSRPTFGRILAEARRAVAQALVEGAALRIEGGVYMSMARTFQCAECEHRWEVAFGTGRPTACPQCESKNIHRADPGGPGAGRGRMGRGGARRKGAGGGQGGDRQKGGQGGRGECARVRGRAR